MMFSLDQGILNLLEDVVLILRWGALIGGIIFCGLFYAQRRHPSLTETGLRIFVSLLVTHLTITSVIDLSLSYHDPRTIDFQTMARVRGLFYVLMVGAGVWTWIVCMVLDAMRGKRNGNA